MDIKVFLKKNRGLFVFLTVIAVIVGCWFLIWGHLGRQVEKAAYEAVFDQLIFDGAYYHRCNLVTVQDYLPEVQEIGAALCGEQLGTLSFPAEEGTVKCPLFACKPLTDAGKMNAVILLERDGGLSPYELAGFRYLDESPSIWAVCSSYGIGRATDLESVTVTDPETGESETITDENALSDFFDKFVKLGEDLGQAGTAKAYYDAYTAEFGESDDIVLDDDTVKAANEEINEKALAFWTKDLRQITIRMKNGYLLRDCIYAPVPKVFSVYGDYAVTVPFFEAISQ
ncbi:MAG: hypothetical protein MJ065_02570 [Oscillospiraceae bacterium]|nr:hypothetical protein [Oscillospiraceae bacterium]